MRLFTLAGIVGATLAQPALAQDLDPSGSLRGFRIEGNVGADRFQAEGTHRNKLGYGGTIGFDGMLGERIVVGPEASYWRADSGSENCIAGVNGGTVCAKSYEEYGVAVRAGFLVTPRLLIFGKGGYVNNDQRKRFDPTTNRFYVNGQIVGPEVPYFRRFNTGGYQAGGGLEYGMSRNVYVNAQYVYSRYDDHTSRQRAMLGVGLRFK